MDYGNGKIYIIRNTKNEKVYIGSTTQSLSKRLSFHKSCNSTQPIVKALKELGSENFYIELIEEFPCRIKEELTAREGFYIRQYNSFRDGYNVVVNGRTKSEWFEDNNCTAYEYNKPYILRWMKAHPEKNRENNRRFWSIPANRERTNVKRRHHYIFSQAVLQLNAIDTSVFA